MAAEPMEVCEPMNKEEAKAKTETKDGAKIVDIDVVTIDDIKEQCRFIERGELAKESRYLARVLRSIVTTRKNINENVLTKLITFYFAGSAMAKQREELLSYVRSPSAALKTDSDKMDTSPVASRPRSPRQPRKFLQSVMQQTLPEIEAYITLLVVIFLMDRKRLTEAEKCANELVKRVEMQNRRSLDPLSAKAHYFYSLINEKLGNLPFIVENLHCRLRTATLHHDDDSQATLINCLLRCYLDQQLYEFAQKLITKVTFPDNATNNEWARYHYYLGRVKAMQLEYIDAQKNLQQALRKAPQHAALSFRQNVQKFLVTVDLLLGEIPERSLFRQAIYRKSLQPYCQLTQAVRIGSVEKFNEVLENNAARFRKEGTSTLILRLRQNVLKNATRKIALAYSRISLADVQNKLQVSSVDDAEYVISKAIKDNVIEASINHEESYMQSKEIADIYSTVEPQLQYHNRILFCLEIYNQAVKAMRFPPKSYAKDIESAEVRNALQCPFPALRLKTLCTISCHF
ncbi:unnamed protein product [Soboliphyme baturini]|uniref:PCI domain-containing protein n=1 Tax=Soboliphyme baturini TaxID=241478 RepID=A0A183IDJ8_9BILA|nr:unnamed protein product [Soboliphyme baturini]